METVFHIKSAFRCVYLLNGVFVEKADDFKYDAASPLYITALPLNAHHLPYTVKISGLAAQSNEHLVSVYKLPEHNCYVKLAARYNYVYSTEHRETQFKLRAHENDANFVRVDRRRISPRVLRRLHGYYRKQRFEKSARQLFPYRQERRRRAFSVRDKRRAYR